jgi:hypothetical protein
MKDPTRGAAGRPIPAGTPPEEEARSNGLSRVTLALLDEYTASNESQGYDPYNASTSGRWKTLLGRRRGSV